MAFIKACFSICNFIARFCKCFLHDTKCETQPIHSITHFIVVKIFSKHLSNQVETCDLVYIVYICIFHHIHNQFSITNRPATCVLLKEFGSYIIYFSKRLWSWFVQEFKWRLLIFSQRQTIKFNLNAGITVWALHASIRQLKSNYTVRSLEI